MKMMDKKNILEKVKKEYLMIALIVGVALMLLGGEGSLKESKANSENTSISGISDLSFLDSYEGNDLDYITYLTESTKNCLESMKGVGAVEVFLTIAPEESTYSTSQVPVIQGIMVVAEGAENPVVVQDITEACEALFSLSVHKIKVVRMRGE